MATISNIWHTPPQTPDVFKSHLIIVVYEAGNQIEQMDSKEYSDLVGERYVSRWCYVDDLIEENDRTRKALDVAKERLKNTILDAEILATPEYLASRAKETLDEITAMEQKDK